MTKPVLAGVVLAGGRSRRMGDRIKATITLDGKPLVRHAIERIRPQVASLALGVESASGPFSEFDLPLVEDPVPGKCGPLGGLLSALSHMQDDTHWLLLVPCDAPFLPADLGLRLLNGALEQASQACLVRYEDELQPTFSLWHRDLQPVLEKAVLQDGLGGFKQFLHRIETAVVDWETAPVSPFFNINSPDDLRQAQELFDRGLGLV